MKSSLGILKWPLIVAAFVVVVRVLLERAGLPESVTNWLSIVALHTFIGPIYIAIRLARSQTGRPYVSLIKLVVLYAVLTRIMILPTYWAGRIFEWTQSRFNGTWGPGVDAFRGFVGVPLVTAAIWIVSVRSISEDTRQRLLRCRRRGLEDSNFKRPVGSMLRFPKPANRRRKSGIPLSSAVRAAG
jgi:hypothetical protein